MPREAPDPRNPRTKRLTLLVSSDLKRHLTRQAKENGVSVSQLVRMRCRPTGSSTISADEALLESLAEELAKAVAEARASLREGHRELLAARAQLSKSRAKRRTKRSSQTATDVGTKMAA